MDQRAGNFADSKYKRKKNDAILNDRRVLNAAVCTALPCGGKGAQGVAGGSLRALYLVQ